MYQEDNVNDNEIFDDYWNKEVLMIQNHYSGEIKSEPTVENITESWNSKLDCYEFTATLIFSKTDGLHKSESDKTKEIFIRIHPTKEKRFETSNNYVMFGNTQKDLFDVCIPTEIIEHVFYFIQSNEHQNFCIKIQNIKRFTDIYPIYLCQNNMNYIIDIKSASDIAKVKLLKRRGINKITLNYTEPVGNPKLSLNKIYAVKFSKEVFEKCMEEKLNWLGNMWQNCQRSCTGFYYENDNWRSKIQHIINWDEHKNIIEYYIYHKKV